MGNEESSFAEPTPLSSVPCRGCASGSSAGASQTNIAALRFLSPNVITSTGPPRARATGDDEARCPQRKDSKVAVETLSRRAATASVAFSSAARAATPHTVDTSAGMDDAVGACRSVSSYRKIDRIGEGTYGIVYKAIDLETGETVALKRVRMEHEKDGLPITSLREIKLLKAVSHPNIVKLLDVVVDDEPDSVFLVFEYVEHDLARLVDSMRKPFSEPEIKCILKQLLEALAYLHENWILHRDVKLSNLLFSNTGELKLCDFGLARLFGVPTQAYTPKVVTLWYRAPELLFGTKTYTAALDLWAVGCIFGELLNHYPIMPGRNELDQIKRFCNLLGAPNEKIWPGFSDLPLVKRINLPHQPYNNLSSKFPNLSKHGIDLLNQLLTYDPEKRITARQALSHRYFHEHPLPCEPALMPTFPSFGAERSSKAEAQQDQPDQRKRKYAATINDRIGQFFGDPTAKRRRLSDL